MSDLLVNKEDIEEQKTPELDEFEQAGVMFNHLSKVFRKKGYALAGRKKRAFVRILESLLFEPLEEVKLEGKEEEELLDLCNEILYHKLKIKEYALMQTEEEKIDE